MFAWVAPLVGLPVGPEVGLLIRRQHLGAAPRTTLVGRMVGLPLGGPAGFFPVAPFLCLPVGLEVGFLVGFHAVVEGCLGRRLAVARSG